MDPWDSEQWEVVDLKGTLGRVTEPPTLSYNLQGFLSHLHLSLRLELTVRFIS